MTFSRITPADYPKLRPFFQGLRYTLSAYSLPSILVWSNDVYHPCAALQEDTLHIGVEFIQNGQLRHLILPVSPARSHSPRQLYDFAVKYGYRRYCFVPEAYIETHGRGCMEKYFTIEPQEGYDDYVYVKDDLATLKGNRYSKKRNLIKQFEREYAGEGRVRVEPITPSAAPDCIDFLEQWCKERDCDANPAQDLACEKLAAIHMLENFGILEVKGLLVRLDGVISALGIGTQLTHNMGVLHFEKAFSRIKGLYQYVDRLCAGHLFNGCTYINKESDMGIPELVKSKNSYHPACLIKSYQLVIR